MRSRLLGGLISVWLLGCGAPVPSRWTPPSPSPRSVVYVSTECSGVLLGPRTVLTAAHCVEEERPSFVWVDAGGREEVRVASCAVHPAAYDRVRECGQGAARVERGHDLAVLILESEIRAARPLPVALVPPFLETTSIVGRSVRLVGWDRQPRLVGPLSRRQGENTVVGSHGPLLVTAPAGDGFATRIGDSGGPLLLAVGDREQVIGVLHGGVARDPRRSVFVSTYDPDNARWLASQAEPGFAQDLDVCDPAHRFGP